MKQSKIFYSNTEGNWLEFGTLSGSHSAILAFLENHHAANFYKIDEVIYKRTKSGYKRN